ncbi:MAG: hypothetical protein PF440_05375 [Thiomicrorhabdus sp.]|nr:hypothetical protein [Thiomicrorhabdus sp.]
MDLGILRTGKSILKEALPDAGNKLVNVFDAITSPVTEPQRNYMWEVYIKDDNGSDIGKNMKYYAKGTAIPNRITEVIKRYYAGVEYTYTGKDTSSKILRVTFWDSQSLETYEYINQWIDMLQDGETNKKALPSTYSRDMVIGLRDTSNLFETRHMLFKDCYPTELTEITLNYNESGEITFDVSFHFSKRYSK